MDDDDPTFEFRKEFKIAGKWWLPAKPENKVTGELSFNTKDGLRLILYGSLKETIEVEELPRNDVILGVSSKAKEISLLNCMCVIQSSPMAVFFNLDPFPTETYRVGRLLHGISIGSLDGAVFSKIAFEYPLLFEWLGIKPFDVKYGDEMNEVTISFDRTDVFSVDVGNGFKITVPYGGYCRYDVPRQFVAEEQYRIVIQSDEERDMKEFVDVSSIVQCFLSLGTGVPIYPERITAYKKIEGIEREVIVSILYDFPRWSGSTPIVSFHEMLFTRKDLGEDIADIIRAWFKLESDLKMVYRALFGNVFNLNQYPENEFLYLIQGLESYHRTMRNNSAEPILAFEARKGRIKAALCESDSDDWIWLAGKLSHANEPSLKVRLTDIFSSYREFVPFLKDEEIEWLIKSVVEARNRMAHPEEGRPVALTGPELILINLILKVMVEGILLFEINIGLTKIQPMMARTSDYRTAELFASRYIPKFN